MDKKYWAGRYSAKETNWDIGYASPAVKEYIDQLTDKNLKILIPGAGSGYEAEYAFSKGFVNTYILDWVDEAMDDFRKRAKGFPAENILIEDFFTHNEKYDLIIEHTFFSSLKPEMRMQYAEKMHKLLNQNGTLAGLLFNRDFENDGPPFGGSKEEYFGYFEGLFEFKCFETAYNSIKPRAGRELFVILKKK